MRRTILLLLLTTACADEDLPAPPIAGCGLADPGCPRDDPPAEPDDEQRVDACPAYLACLDACDDDDCPQACAHATRAPAAECEAERCGAWLVACIDDPDPEAEPCTRLAECGDAGDPATDGGGSTTDDGDASSSSSSSGGTSTETTEGTT